MEALSLIISIQNKGIAWAMVMLCIVPNIWIPYSKGFCETVNLSHWGMNEKIIKVVFYIKSW